ncbi:hypothetical protein JTB14_014876 [Gonioctena quinquepunctata]|nr:hypothetical protein JTB14_014876 [Gonioctena quinquepunctata]
MSRVGLSENLVCCLRLEDDETPEHILCACLVADRIRFSMFGRSSLSPSDLKDRSPGKLLGFVKKLDLFGEPQKILTGRSKRLTRNSQPNLTYSFLQPIEQNVWMF